MPKNKTISVPIHLGDLIGGTYYLDVTEFGAYMRLLFAHYQAGEGGIPDDDKQLARLAGCSPKVWSRVRETVRQKFSWTGSFGIHQRVVDKLQRIEGKSSKAKSNVLKRWEGKDTNVSHSNNERNTSHKPLTNRDISNDISPPLSPKRKKPKSQTETVELPDWMPSELLFDFVANRKAMRKEMTPKAQTLLIREIAKLRSQGHDPTKLLELAIRSGWQGVYGRNETLTVERMSNGQTQQPGMENPYRNGYQKPSKADAVRAALAECYAEPDPSGGSV